MATAVAAQLVNMSLEARQLTPKEAIAQITEAAKKKDFAAVCTLVRDTKDNQFNELFPVLLYESLHNLRKELQFYGTELAGATLDERPVANVDYFGVIDSGICGEQWGKNRPTVLSILFSTKSANGDKEFRVWV